MAQSGVTVRRTAGQPIPEEYLKLVFENFPTAWGAAVVAGTDFHVDGGEEADIEFVRETEKLYPESDITFHFVNSEGALNLDDVPPYPLVEDDESQPLVVGFFDGNFTPYEKKDSSHPGSWWLAESLREKFNGMLETFDGDIDKLMAAIAKPYFRKEMALTSVSRGYITILAYDGQCVTFTQGDTHSEGEPWGWTSNLLGYGKPQEEKQETTAEKPSGFPKRTAKSGTREKFVSSASSGAPTADAPVDEQAKLTARKAELAAQYIVKNDGPPGHLNRKDRGNWFNNRLGYKPPMWESKNCKIDFYVDQKGGLIPYSQWKKLGTEVLLLPKLNNPPRGSDTSTEHIPQTEQVPQEGGDKAVERLIPVLAPAAREAMKKYMSQAPVIKRISENAAIVEDPNVVRQLQEKFADFSSQVGLKDMTDFMRYDFAMFFEVAQMRPDVIACMTWTFRNMLMPHWIAKQKAQKAEEAATETHVLSKEELAPEKPSSFPKRTAKKAAA